MDEDAEIVKLDTANPNFKFLNSLNYTPDVKRKLSQYLDSVVRGSDQTYLTPLGKHNDPEDLLVCIDDILQKNIGHLSPALFRLEYSNMDKFGPRSLAKPWKERKASLLAYYSNDIGCETFDFNVTQKCANLRPLSVDSAINLLKRNTNSGLPYLARKGSILSRLKTDYVGNYGFNEPCVLFTRTQELGKTRNVWGYPVMDVLYDTRFYNPLMNHQKGTQYRNALIGTDSVDKKICNLVVNSKLGSKKLLSIDFSAYDASISTSLQRCAFEHIKRLFQSSYGSEIDKIYERFNTIGIVTPDGVLNGSHGVPSGATFTNEVDSIAQYLIAKFSGLNESNFDIQGDDGAYLLDDYEYEKLIQNFKRFGLKVNEEKSYYNDTFIVYLQKIYDRFYIDRGLIGGIYPISRAMNRLIYQENYVNFEDEDIAGKDYYSIRALTILENCKYHPCFEELVELIFYHDKHKLSFSQKGLDKIMEFENKSTSSVSLIKNQYGDDLKGIRSFESYKLVQKLKAKSGG